MIKRLVDKNYKMLILIVVLIGFVSIAATSTNWGTKTYTKDASKTYTFTIDYSADSLQTNFLPVIPVGAYTTAVLSLRSKTGTVKNWSVTSYLSNWSTSDTTMYNISQVWDTTGQYTLKPVNDTINIALSGAAVNQFLYLKAKGLTGNRENTTLDIAVTLK